MPERRLSFLLISTLLTIALGGWILSTALARTIGQPEQANEILDKSGIYQAVIPAQVADTQKANPSLEGVPLDNPEIQKILATSLDAKKLETEGSKAVSAIYAWLEGKSDKPQIDISIMANQQSLAAAAGDYAAKYAASLPACAEGEADYAAFAARPLEARCLPAGASPEMVKGSVSEAVATNPALGTSTQLTEDDIKLTNGKTIMDSFNAAPVWYQRGKLLPLITSVTALICILLLFIILKPARGMKSAGKHLLSVGITFAVIAFALAWAIEKGFSTFVPKSDNPNVGDSLMRLTTLFNNALRDNIVSLSLYLVVGGVLLLAVAYILMRLGRSTTAPAPVRSTSLGLSAQPPTASFTPIAARPESKAFSTKPARKKKAPAHRKKK